MKYKVGLLGLLIVPSFSSLSKVVMLSDESVVFEIPRSQIKTYIQRGTLEQNLKPVKTVKPGAVSDEELVAIPERYLPPELKEKQKQARERIAAELAQSTHDKKTRPLAKKIGSDVVTVKVGKDKKGKDKIVDIKIDEAVFVPTGVTSAGAILAPQQKLPDVELIEDLVVETSGTVRKEIKPGEPREISEVFQNGKTTDPDKITLLKAFDAYQAKDYATSVSLSLVGLSDAPNEEIKNLSRYLLAHSLFQAGFYASSLNHLSELVTTKWRRSAIGMAEKALEKTRDDGAANQILSKVSVSQIPEEHRPLFSFHLGRMLLNSGARDAALAAFSKVGSDNRRYPEAQYFLGVIQSSEIASTVKVQDWESEGSAVHSARMHFENALVASSTQNSQDLLNLVRVSMARLAYQAKQYNQSIYYYGQVSTASPFVREAAYETAWSLYRIGEFNRSLGVLHPLGSAYFESRDLPELWILRSLNYLKLCRFDEAKRAANTFEHTLAEVSPQVHSTINVLKDLNFSASSEIQSLKTADWIRNILSNDPVVQKDLSREKLLHLERSRLEALRNNMRISDSELRKSSADVLQTAIDRKIAAVGAALKPYLITRVTDIEEEYTTQKARLDLLRFEVYNQATKFPTALERPEANKLIAKGEFLPGVFLKGREILWRYSGEYWQDELRGYDYFIPTECKSEDI